MYECTTCQDWHEVADEETGELVSCPDCCYDAQHHDCADHAVEAEDRPASDGSQMTWTECEVCGFVLTKPVLAGASWRPPSERTP